jgi:hypothetical protein
VVRLAWLHGREVRQCEAGRTIFPHNREEDLTPQRQHSYLHTTPKDAGKAATKGPPGPASPPAAPPAERAPAWLEELTVSELRERGRVLGVVPVGTYRDDQRPGPWMEALRAVRTAAQHTPAVVETAIAAASLAAAARARAAAEGANEAYSARPRQRTLNTASYDG